MHKSRSKEIEVKQKGTNKSVNLSNCLKLVLELMLEPKTQYLFSEFRASEFDELYQEISQVFEISKEQLNALYLIIRE
jgi:hypothetical protein